MSEQNFEEWYAPKLVQYRQLCERSEAIIRTLLEAACIPYLSVSSRTKTVSSALEKLRRKKYRAPQLEMHDLAGIRIICFTESDVRRATETVRIAFDVHDDKSPDKLGELEVDQIGYRSIHLVCGLGSTRLQLPEFASLREMLFELQIRTVLQHAWAEFEHDRNYKMSSGLPSPMKRRLFLAAGLLEIADREFDLLAREIEEYAERISLGLESNQLDVDVNSLSVAEYMRKRFPALEKSAAHTEASLMSMLVQELHAFGIKSLLELDSLIDIDFLQSYVVPGQAITVAGLLRDAMMFRDIERYFSAAWNGHWHACDQESWNLLRAKYNDATLNSVRRRYEFEVGYFEPDQDLWFPSTAEGEG